MFAQKKEHPTIPEISQYQDKATSLVRSGSEVCLSYSRKAGDSIPALPGSYGCVLGQDI